MHSHEVVNILRDLVSFSTVSSTSNENIIDYLENFLRPLGFDMVRIKSLDTPARSNLLCRIGPDKAGGLMLSGHTDVVPVKGQNWLTDPFTLTEHDGRLYGRGTTDMKGFIAATLVMLKQFNFAQLTTPLTLLWTYDEEIGCLGSQHAAPLLKDHLAHLPQAAIIGEPTSFSILRMHAGHATVRMHAKGRGAHSSNPDLGVSAIKAMHRALSGVFALEDQLKTERSLEEYFDRPYVLLNVGEMHGGSAVNIVPDEADVLLGFRPLPDTSTEKIMARINDAAQKNLGDSTAKLTINLARNSPPMLTKEGSKLERVLKPFAKAGPQAAQYSTDGGNLSQSGIECLVFGPGTIDIAHQPNEWIDKNELAQTVGKLDGIIKVWNDLAN